MECCPRRHDDDAVHPNQACGAEVTDSTGQRVAFRKVVGVLQDLRSQLGHRQVGRVERQSPTQDGAFGLRVFFGWVRRSPEQRSVGLSQDMGARTSCVSGARRVCARRAAALVVAPDLSKCCRDTPTLAYLP